MKTRGPANTEIIQFLSTRAFFCTWLSIFLLSCWSFAKADSETLIIKIGYIAQEQDTPLPLSLLDLPVKDNGYPGARLAVKENNTTGKFVNQQYELKEVVVPQDGDLPAEFSQLNNEGFELILVDLPQDRLLEIADSAATGTLLFNVRARDDDLRNQNCRANLFHTAPSRAMLADALAQYLVWKRWDELFLVTGQYAEDKAFADAVRRSAARFRLALNGEKTWDFDAGARRTDSGHVTAQQEVHGFTQVGDYDVMVVADEMDQFGEYLSYRTYLPRPVAGTQGLKATAWHRTHEQWGGTQLQRRFSRLAGRDMTPRDYAAWLAARAIGEAATKLNSTEPESIREFLLSPEFKLAGFKGVPLSFRDWNGQLRQPILLAGPRMLVSVSPQKEFLHQFSPLDTLGWDRPESGCKDFGQ